MESGAGRDKGTRRERCGDGGYACGPGLEHGQKMDDAQAMAALLLAIDGDGFVSGFAFIHREAFASTCGIIRLSTDLDSCQCRTATR